MHQRHWVAALLSAGALSAAFPAAAHAHDKNAMLAREVVQCMKERLKSQQSDSYSQAFKICRQQLDPLSRAGEGARALDAADVSAAPKR